ncbi:hypothetical protein TRM7557_01292 [Tritonibacter multivorans]|uniref:Uncharacterized protein n=1 Tax=Tritonibacter multivorans TaxID=928856 RepID=A0A0P1G6B1_9RHOB|nr:hypothetical protein [Tritonibacter multivorans]MDA7422824.1 hypothetical protein [Tritonibacter multivorans]CUH77275.1 hypothetical protein TRM7557_01292 [Tritonibacter multivorans]
MAIEIPKSLSFHDDTKLKIACEALRQTELQLEDFISLANNSDQRAMAMAAANIGLATVVVTLSGICPSPPVAFLSCVGFVFCFVLSVKSGSPRRFYVRGHNWKDWVGHIDENDTFYDAISSQAEENDYRIEQNLKDMANLARTQKQALTFSAYCLVFFVFGQLGAVVM